MNKTVIIISPAFPFRGGLASYAERLARAFVEEGADVTIYTFTIQYPNFLFPGKTQYSSSTPPTDVKIKRLVSSVNPLNWIKIGKKIKRAKPDLLVFKYWLPFMGPCFGTIARLAKKNKHTKVITILDNIVPHEKRIGDFPFTKYFVKPNDGFVAQSKSVLQELNLFDTKKPRTYSPHPLFDNFGKSISKEQARAHFNLGIEKRVMLFFGIVRAYKGLDLILDAMSKPAIKALDITLIIAGEYYEDSDKYKRQIEEHQLSNHVIQHGHFIPDEEVAHYFCASDVIVQPYKTATQSGVTQIGYHFEKPMIVTNVGGLPEIIPDNKVGFVVPPNADELAKAIEKFYTQELEATFITNVKEEKKKYMWNKMVDAIYQLADA